MEGDNTGIAWYAQYGDAFGVITSFFTAAGTIGLVATIVLQYQTLKAQQLELTETRKELSAQKDELAGQHRMMQRQTEILKEQSETSNYEVFLKEYKLLYDKIPSAKQTELIVKYENLDFEKCLDSLNEKGVYEFLKFIDMSLVSIGGKSKLFYISRTENEKRFLFIASVLADRLFKNITGLIGNNIRKEEFLNFASMELWVSEDDFVLNALGEISREQRSDFGSYLDEAIKLKKRLISHRQYRFYKALVEELKWNCSPEISSLIDKALSGVEMTSRIDLENLLSVLPEQVSLESYGLTISNIFSYLTSDQDAIDKKIENIKHCKTQFDRMHDLLSRYT
ncbi:hypothetical protein CMO91_00480 [Candidatus Woesearchaeota archaeon]|nr:hypothetical protein [Candidatus Woesearchaeota archaeon]